MKEMTNEERIAYIGQALTSLQPGWSYLVHELDARIAELTEQLISNDNEQVRGRIKALLDVKNLPETLRYEQEGMRVALSEQDATD